jgi:hypothetical protein
MRQKLTNMFEERDDKFKMTCNSPEIALIKSLLISGGFVRIKLVCQVSLHPDLMVGCKRSGPSVGRR